LKNNTKTNTTSKHGEEANEIHPNQLPKTVKSHPNSIQNGLKLPNWKYRTDLPWPEIEANSLTIPLDQGTFVHPGKTTSQRG
jgi:hypothetical protein